MRLPVSLAILVLSTLVPVAAADVGPTPPLLRLLPGERCFRDGWRQAFVLGRNPTGTRVADFTPPRTKGSAW